MAVLRRIPDRWPVLCGLMLGRIGFGFAFQSMPTVAPGVAAGLGLDALAIGTLVGLFMLPGLVLAVPGGLLAHWLGERRVLIAGLIAMAAGALICGLAGGYTTLWIGRLVCGIGSILVTVVMSKLVIDWFAGRELATAMGIFLAGYPAGIGLALVSLGPFATAQDWPIGFYIIAAIGFAGLIGFLLTDRPVPVAHDAPPASARLTWRQLAMVSASALVAAFYNGAFLIMLAFMPLFLVSEGQTPAPAATVMGAGVWVSILAVPLGGFVSDRVRRPNLIMTLGALIWAGGILLVLPWSHSPPVLAVLFAVAALVGAFPIGSMIALASEVMRPAVRGPGMGLFYSWFYGAAALAPALAGLLVDMTGQPATAVYLIAAGAIASVVALALFRVLQRQLPPRLAD